MNELYHHGILGQKWGIRRFQNEDGSLTQAGRERYLVNVDGAKNRVKEADRRVSESYKKYARSISFTERKKYKNQYNSNVREARYAREDLKNEKIKSKLNKETSVSKHRQKLIDQYLKKGMTQEEAEIAAYKRARAEKVFAATLGVAVAAAAAYGGYRYYKYAVDDVIKAGTKLSRVTVEDTTSLRDAYYAVLDSKSLDKSKYAGMYAQRLRERPDYGHKVFQKTIDTKLDVKVASPKNAKAIVKEMVNSDSGYKQSLINQINDWKDWGHSPRQQAVLDKAYKSLKSGKVDNNVYNAVNLMLADYESENTRTFYDALRAKGYGAVLDINDKKLSGYNTSKPFIIFDKGATVVDDIRRLGNLEIDENAKRAMKDVMVKELGRAGAKDVARNGALFGTGAAIGSAVKNARNNKIVANYRKDHPNTTMSYTEIIRMYEKNKASK